jgi:hypothetical protein
MGVRSIDDMYCDWCGEYVAGRPERRDDQVFCSAACVRASQAALDTDTTRKTAPTPEG